MKRLRKTMCGQPFKFQQLTPGEKQQFLYLRDNGSRRFTYMTQACAQNSFAISSGVVSRASNHPVHGLFLLHSRFNHSCIPNSEVPITGKEIVTSFAVRDIVVGEEITICYNTDFACRVRYERHQALRFVCDCKACATDNPFQPLSDLRRRMIRVLQYLTLGVDIGGQRPGSVMAITVEPQLRKAAENFRIPLSARLIYDLLVVCLLEEEGPLDDFMVQRVQPGILRPTRWFQTENNAQIARHAIEQGSGQEKLGVASQLYGRGDVADYATAETLLMLHGRSVKA